MKKKLISSIITIVFVALIILYTYPLIGLWGQVKSTSYPLSYENSNYYLTNNNIEGHIIYLPWQTYLTYNWTLNISSDGRIANPINKVIEPLIITGPDKYGPVSKIQDSVTKCLLNKSIECLENNSVQYVLKDKCAYFPHNYSWINESIVHEDSCITIHEINNKNLIDRTIRPPLRFVVGCLISIIALIKLILFVKKKDI